jgi:hypothetical protein
MAQTLKLLAEKFEQVIKQQQLTEGRFFVPEDVPEVQGKAIDALVARGYRFNSWIKPAHHNDEESGLGCATLQKSKRYTHSFVEVEPDGSCNGEPCATYLAGLKKLNEVESPGSVSEEDKVLQATNEYVKSMSTKDMSKYLTEPENAYSIAWELTHQNMVDGSDMMDDDMADAELDSDEVAEKACEGIAKFMGGTHAFNLVYDIARPHMPN